MHKTMIGLILYDERRQIDKFLRKSEWVLNEHYEEVLRWLSNAEKKVLSLWFGLEDGHFRSQEEIAEELDIYAGYIYLAQFVILRKICLATRRAKLKDFLD